MYTLTARNSGYHTAELDFPLSSRSFQPAAHSTSTLGCSIGLSKGTSPPIAPPEPCAPPVNGSSVLPVTQTSDLSFFHTSQFCRCHLLKTVKIQSLITSTATTLSQSTIISPLEDMLSTHLPEDLFISFIHYAPC